MNIIAYVFDLGDRLFYELKVVGVFLKTLFDRMNRFERLGFVIISKP